MSQTSFIVGALFVGYLIYITMQGSLPKYMAIMVGNKCRS